jgi:predicted nucleic acid-binding protein
MTHLLDTSILVRVIGGHKATVEAIAQAPATCTLGTSIIVRGELVWGAMAAAAALRDQELRRVLQMLEDLAKVLPVTPRIADVYGELQASLDPQGKRLPANDAWIAATALVHDLVLVSEDPHFGRVPGLKVENWAKGTQV